MQAIAFIDVVEQTDQSVAKHILDACVCVVGCVGVWVCVGGGCLASLAPCFVTCSEAPCWRTGANHLLLVGLLLLLHNGALCNSFWFLSRLAASVARLSISPALTGRGRSFTSVPSPEELQLLTVLSEEVDDRLCSLEGGRDETGVACALDCALGQHNFSSSPLTCCFLHSCLASCCLAICCCCCCCCLAGWRWKKPFKPRVNFMCS